MAGAGVRKVVFGAVAVAAFAAAVYWKWPRPSAGPVVVLPSLLKRSLAELQPLSDNDQQVLIAGEGLYRQKRYADAVREFERFQAKDGSPGHLRAVLTVGLCQLQMGDAGAAERSFGYVLSVAPDDADAHRGRATALDLLGALNEAEAHMLRVAEIDPTDVRMLMMLARNQVELHFDQPAEETARRALARNPRPADRDELTGYLVSALLGQKRYADAVEAGKGVDTPAVRAARAECFRNLNRPADAVAEVDAALAADPADPKVRAKLFLERGRLRADGGDFPSAVLAFEEALKADEHDLAARLQLAQALRRTGQKAKADAADAKFKDSEARLKRASDLIADAITRPNDAAVRRELADACRAINRPVEAEMWLAAAAAIEAKPK